MVSEDPRDWIGRGNEVVPGKPFGWAHNMERQAIREHLVRRGWTEPQLHFRMVRIQERLRKYQPTWRERQKVWLAKQPKPTGANGFTWEELEHLADLFGDANHPLSASIGTKAKEALAKRAP